MKKTHKKLEYTLVKALTDVCELAKDWECGFAWLTHTANYDKFPDSLMITCVFDTDEAAAQAKSNGTDNKLSQLILFNLSGKGVAIKNINAHIRLDSEQRCDEEDNGDWDRRINRMHR